ncbi:MAG: hypothetical protein Q7T82_15800 [Armatimonadota bacterium]|nr:hypothetical protein [Armatimonadota bacterium]
MSRRFGTCKLCRTYSELRESHFIPKAAYRIIERTAGSPPVVVKPEITIQKNEQMKDYILCADCEERFNKNGEDYVMRYCYTGEKGFRLKDLIDATEPIACHDGLKLYSASGIPEIDVEKLTYFISSVMWRGSAHRWKSGRDVRANPSLAKYEEELRKYLLGEADFPKNAAVWINIVPDSEKWALVANPYGGRLKEFWHYNFPFLGILFWFFLGKRMPLVMRTYCSFRSEQKFIMVGDKASDMIMRDCAKLMGRSKRILVPQLDEDGI